MASTKLQVVAVVVVVLVVALVGPSSGFGWRGGLGGGGKGGKGLPRDVNGGMNCAVCTLLVSLSEQLAEINNETTVAGLQRICSYLPVPLQGTCDTFIALATPILIEMAFDDYITPDVACQLLGFCYTDPGQQACHLYPLPSVGLDRVLAKVRQRLPSKYSKDLRPGADVKCPDIPVFKEICETIEIRFGDHHLPILDIDQDGFSVFNTLRGSYWRGKDCNDLLADHHPGAKAIDNDEVLDSDCNGIYGIDPIYGAPYEETMCYGRHMGVALLGDSAGAHFHIPKEWVTATDISLEAFENILMIIENELDWPMTSGTTGYMNSTWPNLHGPTDSLYLRIRELNRCNHRDYQNIAVNGASAGNMNSTNQYGLKRDKHRDHPLMVMYSVIGNDVCNGHNDTIADMTTPAEMKADFLDTLKYLDTMLPSGSHVLVSGLADGRVLYNTLRNRIHPIGEWRHDVTYPDLYDYLSCLQVSPCSGWMSSNETLRNFTSERAANLSKALQEVVDTHTFKNFDALFFDFDINQAIKRWEARGGEAWQLIEPVDGFHPSQVSMALTAEILWEDIKQSMPDVIKELTNPNNQRIMQIFGDQGGY